LGHKQELEWCWGKRWLVVGQTGVVVSAAVRHAMECTEELVIDR
jgi:hypothetical protein